MRNVSKFVLITVVALILILVLSGLVVVFTLTLKGDGNKDLGIKDGRFYGLGVAPSGVEDLPMYDLPDADDLQANIELAVQIYQKASQLDLQCENRLLLNSCPTVNVAGGMENYIDLDIVEIKNKDQYFRIDYRLTKSIPLFDNPLFSSVSTQLNNMLELILTERRYYDPTLDMLKYQKVKNSGVAEGIPYADWNNEITAKDMPVPIYRADQYADGYEKCEHSIGIDTIKSAKVTFNQEVGCYEVDLVLDVDNPKTTAKKLPEVKAGTNDPNAAFTKLDVKFSVWKSGYFRTFSYFEIWQAKVTLGIAVRGEFDNNEIYSYDERDCDIENYSDANQYLVALGLREGIVLTNK